MNDNPNGPGRTFRLTIAWAIIAISVAAIARHAYYAAEARHDSSVVSGFQTEIKARYILGHQLFTMPAMTQGLRDSLLKDTDTPIDRLRLIPVIGELQDARAAENAADEILKKNPPEDLRHDTETLWTIYHGDSVAPADVQGLRDRYGFFGRLADAHLQGPDSALQLEIKSQSLRTFLGIVGLLITLLVAFVVGLTLLIIFATRFFDGKMPPRLQRAQPSTSDALVEGFAIYLLGMAALIFIFARLSLKNVAWESLLAVPVVLAVLWALRAGSSGRLRDAVGWWRGEGVLREMGAGIVGYISALPFMAVALLITTQLTRLAAGPKGPPVVDHPIIYQLLTPGFSRMFLIFFACIFAPIAEELMFRGLLLGHLRGFFGWVISAIIVSLIFAGIHPQGWEAIPILGTLAMMLAALREQRDSLIAPMTAHALNNTVALIFLLIVMG